MYLLALVALRGRVKTGLLDFIEKVDVSYGKGMFFLYYSRHNTIEAKYLQCRCIFSGEEFSFKIFMIIWLCMSLVFF